MREQRQRPGPLRWLRHLLDELLVRILSLSLFHVHAPEAASRSGTELVPVAKYVPIPKVRGLPLVGTLLDLIAAGGATQ